MREKVVGVIGANDPENDCIMDIFQKYKIPYILGENSGKALKHNNALAEKGNPKTGVDNVDQIITLCQEHDCDVVLFQECTGTHGCRRALDRASITWALIDHHQPDDVGSGFEASNFMVAGSLPIMAWILGVTLTRQQKIVAAMDAFRLDALAGRCDDGNDDCVSSNEALDMEIKVTLARNVGLEEDAFREMIHDWRMHLKDYSSEQGECILVGVAQGCGYFPGMIALQLAAVLEGKPIAFVKRSESEGDWFLFASPHSREAWIRLYRQTKTRPGSFGSIDRRHLGCRVEDDWVEDLCKQAQGVHEGFFVLPPTFRKDSWKRQFMA